jgi:hypothetical protein
VSESVSQHYQADGKPPHEYAVAVPGESWYGFWMSPIEQERKSFFVEK